jgi:lipopolysaccharide/colanic/teichoic acid biosynthesis glycosyltransferase
MQRYFDFLFSSAALIILSPLLVPIVVLLRLTGEGEIFFLQDRVGKDGIPFKLYKFVTMLKDSPNIGTGSVTMKRDPRILSAGKFLRKTKINELPQLLNILFGEMSVIGPRPQTPRCFNAFPDDLQQIIIKVKPGLSGIGSIVFRGEENILEGDIGNLKFYDNIISPYKGRVEAWYVDKQTITMYFILILATIWIVMFPKSTFIWRFFKDLPTPPVELKSGLNYPH